MRVGFFGGSFDPPHRGHLAIAEAATETFSLDRVLLAPTARQPLKPSGHESSFADRLAMVGLLCASSAGPAVFEPSALDAPKPNGEPNYTIDTLRQLRQTLAQGDSLFVIVGADAFLDLPRWRDPAGLLDAAEWIVISRPGAQLIETHITSIGSLAITPEQRSRIHLLMSVAHPASATSIRALLRAGDDCAALLPSAVLGYIPRPSSVRDMSPTYPPYFACKVRWGLGLGLDFKLDKAVWLPPCSACLRLLYASLVLALRWLALGLRWLALGLRWLALGLPLRTLGWKGTRSFMASTEVNRMLAAAVEACEDKKAEDIRILALDPAESGLSDYFLICSGNSDRQNIAITDAIEYKLKHEFGTYPTSVEGRRQGEWILMDYVDFIVHVFSHEKRAFYGLERLRKSATSLSLADLNEEIRKATTAISTNRAKKTAPAKAVKKAAAAPAKKAVAKKAAVKTVAAKKASSAKKTATLKKSAPAKKSAAKKVAAKKKS